MRFFRSGRTLFLCWRDFRLISKRFARIRQAALFLWAAGVAGLSLLPSPLKDHFHTKGMLHFPAHFVVFAFGTFLLLYNAQTFRRRVLLCVPVLFYALLIETLQALDCPCPIEWEDVLVDAAGVLLVLFCTSMPDAAPTVLEQAINSPAPQWRKTKGNIG